MKMKKYLYDFAQKLIMIRKYIALCCRARRIHKKENKCVFLIATPIYRNLGDYAILKAEYNMLSECGLKDNTLELNRREYEFLKPYLNRIIKENDVIIIDGGGNIGTLWIEEELKIRSIIVNFKNNPIIIFPQTAYFEDSDWGRKELNESISIYNSHKKLTVFCRDRGSYELFVTRFSVSKVYFVPDIVTYLQVEKTQIRNDVCLVCLRDDNESMKSEKFEEKIISALLNKGIKYECFSTISDIEVTKKNRFNLLEEKLLSVSKSKCIITDRLHGMLFAAITGTPCVAIDNISHKVKNGYEWIKSLEYILFVEEENQIEKAISQLLLISESNYNFNKSDLSDYHKLIKEVLKNEAS